MLANFFGTDSRRAARSPDGNQIVAVHFGGVTIIAPAAELSLVSTSFLRTPLRGT